MDQYLVIGIAAGGGAFVLVMGGLWKFAYELPRHFGRIATPLQALCFGAIMALLGFNQGIYLASVTAPGQGLTDLAVSSWWALVPVAALAYIYCLARFVTKLKPPPETRRKRRSGSRSAAPEAPATEG